MKVKKGDKVRFHKPGNLFPGKHEDEGVVEAIGKEIAKIHPVELAGAGKGDLLIKGRDVFGSSWEAYITEENVIEKK